MVSFVTTMRQINLRVSEELLARIDVARDEVPRERWLRGVVEQALGGAVKDSSGVNRAEPPAPAEQSPVAGSGFAVSMPEVPVDRARARAEMFRGVSKR